MERDANLQGRVGAHFGLRSGLALSVLALILGLALTAGLAVWQQSVERRLQREQFERLAESGFDAIEHQIRSAMLLVRAVQSVFLASDPLNEHAPDGTPSSEAPIGEQAFRRIYENLGPRQAFPSLQAFAYNHFLGNDPFDGPRFRVELVAPLAGNEALLGLDVGSQPENMRAILRSRDGDRPVLSEPFPLAQFNPSDPDALGVVIRLPVFSPGPLPRSLRERRQRFVGSLAVSFRLRSLIEGALSEEALAGFALHVEDATGNLPLSLYDSRRQDAMPSLRGDTGFERIVELGTRRWRMEMHPIAASVEGPSAAISLILTLGALASVLLALLLNALVTTRNRALTLADRMASEGQESELRFRTLNELLPALVMVFGARDGRLRQANRAARERLGLDRARIDRGEGPLLAELLTEPNLTERVLGLDEEDGLHGVNTTLRLADEQPWVSLSVAAVELSGEASRLLVASDIGELRRLNERLAYQASHDALTGLINRYEFERLFDQLIARVNIGGGTGALLYIDLDQFKVINDTCGHYAGDQLLAELASRLSSSLKTGDVLARLGGDEFGALLFDVDDEQALAVAERARSAIDGFVFVWEQRGFAVSASIGVVMIDNPGMSRRELLARADTACYMAKERGRNRAHLFEDSDHDTAQRRTEMEWAAHIRRALAERRFVLDYQELSRLKPVRSGGGAHFELLVRLIGENGEEVPPGAFIPAAERFGLMPLIDRWVVETALSGFERLHPSGDGFEMCAINLSGATVEDEKFAEHALALIDRYRIPAHKVCFEITETVAVNNVARVVRFIQLLRARGCRFALDDFGSGMASFGYLKSLPVDILKIDGSFIHDIENDASDYSIVRAITDIGHQMGLLVIAEWVDSPRSAELLRGIGVDLGQGFALHCPERVMLHRG